MLRPIPARILKHSATLQVVKTVDAWKKVTEYTDHALSRICVSVANTTLHSKDNTSVTLRGLLFYDRRLSGPQGLDFKALKNQSDLAGGDMRILFADEIFTVEMVDTLYDDIGCYHHTELGLI